MESSRPFTVIPFGAPGSGKSNLCNILVGQPGKFYSSKTAASGETKSISYCQAPAFGKSGNKLLQVWDAPGMGELELSLTKIVEDIKTSIGPEMSFDAAVIVVKVQDYRATA